MQVPVGSRGRPAGPQLSAWLSAATDDPGPFEIEEMESGSHEMHLVTSPAGARVLRRPAVAAHHASVHGVEREYRLLLALADTHIPVPRPIAIAREPVPGGRPALLLEHIDGVPLGPAPPRGLESERAGRAVCAAVDVLADLHSLPWRELGLDDLGPADRFLANQVVAWRARYERVGYRELSDVGHIAAWLEEHRPEEGEAGLIHGDFHFGNLLFTTGAVTRLAAVVDWERATLGDPLVDVGLLLSLCGPDGAEPASMYHAGELARGGPDRAALGARYERRSGRSLQELRYYQVLAMWQLAIAIEGDRSRRLRAGGAADELLARDASDLLAAARRIMES